MIMADMSRWLSANHIATLASIDFLIVPTLTGRVLFVFVALMHHRRRIVHINVTYHHGSRTHLSLQKDTPIPRAATITW